MKALMHVIILVLTLTLSTVMIAGGSPDRPLQSVYLKAVDEDTKPDRFVYRIKESKELGRRAREKGGVVAVFYEGSLTITAATGQVLWDHEWVMTERDLIHDLLVKEADISSKGKKLSLEDWVKRFFDGSLNYGPELRQTKLTGSDLDAGQIAFWAERLKTKPTKLKQDILSQKIHTVFTYRAEWREDLIKLVYVPTVHKFVLHSRGY